MAEKKDTYIPRDECVDLNAELGKSLKEVEDAILAHPNVLSVGLGMKKSKGTLQRELCFKITVDRKKEAGELKKNELIPPVINGIKTDVEEVLQTIPGAADSKKYRPLIGGSQMEGSSGPGSGTLGCFGKRNSDDKIVILSNWHVLMSNENTIDGARAGQPSHNGCCSCCACNEIGEVVAGEFMANDMDAAIALLDGQEADTIPEVRYINEILDLGFVTGATAPLAGETVYKRGRTTGLTKGQVQNSRIISNTPYVFYNGVAVLRNNQCAIDPVAPHVDYFLKGDSGSVSLNEKNQVVALNYGFDPVSHVTVATDITDVMTQLQFTILDSTFHSGATSSQGNPAEGIPFGGMAAGTMAGNPTFLEAFEQLEAELNQYEQGKRMMNLFAQHRTEMFRLVNENREMKAAWNRYQGPSFLAHIARSIRKKGQQVPAYIKGISMQNLILKMTAVLQRNGSENLAKDVTENYLDILNVIGKGKTPDEWKAALMDQHKNTNR